MNLVQYDRQLTIDVRIGQKTASVDDARLQRRGAASRGGRSDRGREGAARLAEPAGTARRADLHSRGRGAAERRELRPARARADGQGEHRHLREEGRRSDRATSRRSYQTNCTANTKGLFAYYRSAEAGFILTCRMADGSGSGWAGITGIKDISMINAAALTDSRGRQGAEEPQAEGARAWPLHRHPRTARQRALALADDGHLQPGAAAGRSGGPRRSGWRRRRRRIRRWRRQQPVHGRQEAGRQDLQRTVLAQERHRQSDPAADADPAATTAGGAGDVGRERHAARTSPAVRTAAPT